MGGIVALRDGIDTLLIPNGTRAESAVVKVVESILLLVSTELVPTCWSVRLAYFVMTYLTGNDLP
jgi:hypothetical protein